MYARTIFYKINTMDPLNPEAAVLWVIDVLFFQSPQFELFQHIH